MAQLNLKVKLGEDVRRFSLPEKATVQDLQGALRTAFSDVKGRLIPSWTDEEGDECIIITQEEWVECLRANGKPPIRLNIKVDGAAASPAPAVAPEPTPAPVTPAPTPVVVEAPSVQPVVAAPAAVAEVVSTPAAAPAPEVAPHAAPRSGRHSEEDDAIAAAIANSLSAEYAPKPAAVVEATPAAPAPVETPAAITTTTAANTLPAPLLPLPEGGVSSAPPMSPLASVFGDSTSARFVAPAPAPVEATPAPAAPQPEVIEPPRTGGECYAAPPPFNPAVAVPPMPHLVDESRVDRFGEIPSSAPPSYEQSMAGAPAATPIVVASPAAPAPSAAASQSLHSLVAPSAAAAPAPFFANPIAPSASGVLGGGNSFFSTPVFGPPAELPAESNRGGIFVHQVPCSACQFPIIGNRYPCSKCAGYCLCESCFNRVGTLHPGHFFLMGRPGSDALEKAGMEPGEIGAPVGGGRQGSPGANWHSNNAAFHARLVEEVPVASLTPGQQFTKLWSVRNDGTRQWPEHTYLIQSAGNQMTVSPERSAPAIPIPTAKPGETVMVALELQAPPVVGNFWSSWRLCTSTGHRFGQALEVHVVVASISAPLPIGSTAVPIGNTTASPVEVNRLIGVARDLGFSFDQDLLVRVMAQCNYEQERFINALFEVSTTT